MALTLKADSVLSKPLTRVPTCTVATLPTASEYPNHMILVTNGNAGLGCLAISDGANWYPITVGTTACAGT